MTIIITQKEDEITVSNLDDSARTIKNGDVFLISFEDSQTTTVNIVEKIDQSQYVFVNLNSDKHWSEYEYLENELLELEEIVDYLDYLTTSGEANVDYIGQVSCKSTIERIAFVSSTIGVISSKDTEDISFVEKYLNKVRESYALKKRIEDIVVENGDTISTYSTDRASTSVERVRNLGERYLVLPIDRQVDSSIEEESLSRDELSEYLFDLAVTERMYLKYIHTFNSSKQTSFIYHKLLEELTSEIGMVVEGV